MENTKEFVKRPDSVATALRRDECCADFLLTREASLVEGVRRLREHVAGPSATLADLFLLAVLEAVTLAGEGAGG